MTTFKRLVSSIRATKTEDLFMVITLTALLGFMAIHGARVFVHLWGDRIRGFWTSPVNPVQVTFAALILASMAGAVLRAWLNHHGRLPGSVPGGRLLVWLSVLTPAFMGCWIMLTSFRSGYLGVRDLIHRYPVGQNPLEAGGPFFFIFGFIGCAVLGMGSAFIAQWLLPGYLTAHLDEADRARMLDQLSPAKGKS